MKKQKESLSITDKLRKEAESFLNRQKKSDSAKPFSEADKLIHELRVHQIELELQNEELTLAKEKAEFAEKKYTELYDFAPAGHLSLSKAGEIINLNRSTERLLGKERSSLIKSSFGFFVSPEMRIIYNEFLQQVFSTGLIQNCELKLVIDEDFIKYVLVNGVSSKLDEKCLVTLTDITLRKHMEQELIKARQKAEENDRLKSAFLANMSHEIRTPMNGILGFTELLKDLDLTGQEKHSYIHIIEKSGTRMLNIINDIISISRIEARETEVVVSNTNINEQLEYLYNFFKLEAKQKKIQLSIKNALPKNEAFIRTDREKVYAVLTNLVKNALKFTKSGFIEFGYEVKGEYLEFYVKDSGSGIPDEQKDSIFERFRQVSDTLNRNFEGSGLGLPISKAYVEMLGGKIWVESNIEQGSTFRFNLPYLSVINTKEQFQTGVGERIIPNPKLKMLVVDDDETSRVIISLILRDFECQIIQVASGHEAVITCRNNPDIDLVLMDIQMQGMDGYEATRKIRAFNKEVIIIAQTALALNGDRENAIKSGCNNYISKPIRRKALLDLINQYVGDKSVNDVIFS
ncbi:MAG: ATP-binding protein [Lentimicrobium sp.]|jgi:PAS domain S-box-containing protein|nr:ATP-binding protein [Lentimicrobium sp.]